MDGPVAQIELTGDGQRTNEVNASTVEAEKVMELTSQQVLYRRRKAKGLCARLGCDSKPEKGRTRCAVHLREMTADQQRRFKERDAKGLCWECGQLPQFWSVRCVVCRARAGRHDPLPAGARKALRLYREADRQRELEHAQVEARFAARKLLITGEVTGSQARALRLYVGADKEVWRTYDIVGKRIGISKQAVQKLLEPYRDVFANVLNNSGFGKGRKRSEFVTRQQLAYRKRRTAGVCTRSRCLNEPESGRTRCAEHLKETSAGVKKLKAKRNSIGLCEKCGELPQFWGKNCILCRTPGPDPLPRGARRALRKYQEREAARRSQEEYWQLRRAASKLIDEGNIAPAEAQALRLYIGLDRTEVRTHREVGELMRLTGERVRQLLQPSKIALEEMLGHAVVWKSMTMKRADERTQRLPTKSKPRVASMPMFSTRTPAYQLNVNHR